MRRSTFRRVCGAIDSRPKAKNMLSAAPKRVAGPTTWGSFENMTTQLLAQALATAADPNADKQRLREVVGDLIRFGAFDAAESVIARLKMIAKLRSSWPVLRT